jgi:hypothetical protein
VGGSLLSGVTSQYSEILGDEFVKSIYKGTYLMEHYYAKTLSALIGLHPCSVEGNLKLFFALNFWHIGIAV